MLVLFSSCSGPAAVSSPPSVGTNVSNANDNWIAFQIERIELLRWSPFAGIELWQYLTSLIHIILAFGLTRLIDMLVRGRVRKWAEKTKTIFDDVMIDLVRGPLNVVVFVSLLRIGMTAFKWLDALETMFSKTFTLIVAGTITYVLFRGVDVFVGLWHKRSVHGDNEQFGKELLPLIRKSLKVFVLIVALLVTSQNLGFNVTGLIASLSIGGLAIGLAAQDTLGNLFGAVAILMDKPFRVGQLITLGNVTGFVESIGFRSTRVRNLDGHLVSIPNKEVGNATITNITERPNIRTVMNIGIVYDSSLEKVEQALQLLDQALRAHPRTEDAWISFNRFADFALNIQVIHWWSGTDYKGYLAEMNQINLEVKRQFDLAQIDFAFPTQTVHLKPETRLPNGNMSGSGLGFLRGGPVNIQT